jgi:hypothetical protein
VKRTLRIFAAAAAVVAAIACTLFAADVLLLQRGMSSGDTRFASGTLSADLWRPRQLVPFGAARSMLAVNDDVAYRDAIRAFVLGRPRDQPFRTPELLGQRGHARDLLQAVVESHQNAKRRAEAANLIGVLGFANAAIDPDQAYSYLSEAIGRFRQSIALDPRSDDAKYNLELALTRIKKTPKPSGQKQPRDSRGGTGGGAGTGDAGSGY